MGLGIIMQVGEIVELALTRNGAGGRSGVGATLTRTAGSEVYQKPL